MSAENDRIKAGIHALIERDRQINTRRAPAPAPAVDTSEMVDAADVGQWLFDSRNAGYEKARSDAAYEAALAAHKSAGDALAQDALRSVTSWYKPLVTAIGELVTSGHKAHADLLLSFLTEDPEHFVEAAQLQEALGLQEMEANLEADAAIELARLAEASKVEAMREAARADSDNAFLERNPNANLDLLFEAQERAAVTHGLDLSLAEVAPRVKVAAAAFENQRTNEGIRREAWKSSQTLQKRYPDGPPAPDPDAAFRTAARVVSLSENERMKAAMLEPSAVEGELSKVKASAQERQAEDQRVDLKRRGVTT